MASEQLVNRPRTRQVLSGKAPGSRVVGEASPISWASSSINSCRGSARIFESAPIPVWDLPLMPVSRSLNDLFSLGDPAAALIVLSAAGGRLLLVKRVTARTAHEIPDRAPLRLTVGDEVQVGDHDTEWPEFVFVTAAHGTGWVPARHLSQPFGPAVVQTAYDTTELPTQVGEALDVLAEDQTSGWLWCRSSRGRQGWVPLRTIDEEG